MSETLSNFLIDLASDPARLASFTADPDGVLAMSQLTGIERAAMVSGDPDDLRVALAAARKGAGKGVKTKKKKKGGGDEEAAPEGAAAAAPKSEAPKSEAPKSDAPSAE